MSHVTDEAILRSPFQSSKSLGTKNVKVWLTSISPEDHISCMAVICFTIVILSDIFLWSFVTERRCNGT